MPAPLNQPRQATPANVPRVNAAAATVMAAKDVKAGSPEKAVKAVNAANALKKVHPHPTPCTLKHPCTKLR